jgi:hypothetical protein
MRSSERNSPASELVVGSSKYLPALRGNVVYDNSIVGGWACTSHYTRCFVCLLRGS